MDKRIKKVTIVKIVISIIIPLTVAMIGVFSPEVRAFVYDLFHKDSGVEGVIESTEPNIWGTDQESDGVVVNPVPVTTNDADTLNNGNNSSNDDNKNDSLINKTTEKNIPSVSKPSVSTGDNSFGINKGDKITSINFLGVEAVGMSIQDRSIEANPFYKGLETSYRGDDDAPNTVTVISLEGYGLCCTVPIKKEREYSYNLELCDSAKNPIGVNESRENYTLRGHFGIKWGDDEMMFAFSLVDALAPGNYYCRFNIYDRETSKENYVYINFSIE